MLEPGPNCECCDKDLLPGSEGAVICTFCNECAEIMLKSKCPDCGGNFVPRPPLKKSGCATNA
ncbi:MAG: DUF1272 domain-containing protein [Gammaproteobacteria bacterium]|nr:DUF1272 domain-containing protein [Gammaproteobacteria bacterium]